MKQTVLLMMLALMAATAVEAQTKMLKPDAIFKMPSISLDEYNRLFALNEEGKLSPKEKVAFETCGIFDDLYAGFCSWYCGGIVSEVTSSSALSAKYAGENAHDFSILNAWAEGVPGGGVGEYLLYTFPGKSAPVTIVEILNGYTKTKKAWKNNGRVKRLKMYYNGKPYAILELKDTRSLQSFNVGQLGPFEAAAPDWTLKFEILEVYPGDKYDDTVITELYFGGISPH